MGGAHRQSSDSSLAARQEQRAVPVGRCRCVGARLEAAVGPSAGKGWHVSSRDCLREEEVQGGNRLPPASLPPAVGSRLLPAVGLIFIKSLPGPSLLSVPVILLSLCSSDQS